METKEEKERIYVDDFMSEDEENDDYKMPRPVLKNKETFHEKKENFDIQSVLTKFIIKKELFIYERKGDVYQYYDFTDKVLGEGGFGVVFLVKEKETGHFRAAKKIPRAKIRNYQRFINEVSTLKLCDHPNIVKLYEIFEEKDNVFLIQEYLAGGELFEYIEEQDHLTENEAARIFKQIIRALIYCHENDITHRDLKPENFMFKDKSKDSALKLIDFGYARKFQKEAVDTSGRKFERMRSKVGSENYLAPEILKRNYSNSCDVWAAGVILYIMLCGCPPFDGEDEEETFAQIEKIEYDFDDGFENVSEDAKDLIRNILKPESERLTLQEVLEHDWVQKYSATNDGKVVLVNLAERLKNFTRATKLRKAVSTLIATQISDRDISDSIRTFQAIDKNMDGYITMEELEEGMASLTPEQRREIMRHVDLDQNQAINYNEFIAATLNDKSLKNSFSINKAFNFFDRDGNGQIEKDELQMILQGAGLDRVETSIIKEILLECDINNDGVIDRDEFFRCMSYKKQETKGFPIDHSNNLQSGNELN